MIEDNDGVLKCYPDAHFRITTDIPWSMGINARGFIATSGQVDLDRQARVLHPGDPGRQAEGALVALDDVLGELQCRRQDLRKLVVFHTHGHDTAAMMAALRTYVSDLAVPPVLAFMPLPYLSYEEMLIEIDAYGLAASDSETPFALSGGVVADRGLVYLGTIRVGERSGTFDPTRLASLIDDALCETQSGIGLDNLVQATLSVPPATPWNDDALAALRAAFTPARQPILKIVPTAAWEGPEAVRLHGFAVLNPRELAFSSHVENGETACRVVRWRNLVWAGDAAPHRPDGREGMGAQSRKNMEALLAGLVLAGSSAENILKLNTTYGGSFGTADFHASLEVRKGYFEPLGPCSTGYPVPRLVSRHRLIEIDAIAARPAADLTPDDPTGRA